MTTRAAVKILIQSPIYFRLGVSERLELVHEFCDSYLNGRQAYWHPDLIDDRPLSPHQPGPGRHSSAFF